MFKKYAEEAKSVCAEHKDLTITSRPRSCEVCWCDLENYVSWLEAKTAPKEKKEKKK